MAEISVHFKWNINYNRQIHEYPSLECSPLSFGKQELVLKPR